MPAPTKKTLASCVRRHRCWSPCLSAAVRGWSCRGYGVSRNDPGCRIGVAEGAPVPEREGDGIRRSLISGTGQGIERLRERVSLPCTVVVVERETQPRDQLGACGDAEPPPDTRDVMLRRAWGDEDGRTDFGVGLALEDQPSHF